MATPLTKRYGDSLRTYFSGSPLNRVSFLRDDYKFLSDALTNSATRFIAMRNFDPAVTPSSGALKYLSYSDVKTTIGNPFAKSEKEVLAEWDSTKVYPLLVFLGLDESAEGIKHEKYSGVPYFALDVSPLQPSATSSAYDKALAQLATSITDAGAEFVSIRTNYVLNYNESAIYAMARSYMDWNLRNPFCAGCGAKTMSVNAGAKRVCPPTDSGKDKPSCPSRGVVTNISFPRTDPTIIVAVVNSTGDRLLLGRNKRFPNGFYSCLAGFLEPGESIEEAVRREVWEESGVKLGKVVIYASQPWPYPSSLMLGAIAEALPGDGEKIHLEHDPELGDAQWFPFDVVRTALQIAEQKSDLLDISPADTDKCPIKVPPSKAIAHNLMHAVVNDNAHLPRI
ncbi:NUDIX hydrolase domain-like protein [Lipomyces oligophaga]|uniref:NUDIX hydrolase domain-like protein n=1 Tax=Lipomyces oligophaga TaxID=45792 RepID=UPI0034CEF1D6